MADPFAPAGGGGFGTDAFDWIYGFGKSAMESVPELIGITPSTETTHWRQDNPISGVVSEMAGMAVPYMGWLKAAKAIPRFEKAISSIGSLEKSPFISGALQEGARFLPFEAGRLAVSQVAGDKSFGDMLGETSLNLALGAGIGGVIHGIAGAGSRNPGLKTIFGDTLDLAAPLPLQARQMRDIINSGKLSGDDLGRANMRLSETLRDARVEEIPQGMRYVAPLSHELDAGGSTKDITHQLNRLFRVKENTEETVLQVRKFAQGSVQKAFPTEQLWKKEADAAGLPANFEEHGQYYRQIGFRSNAENASTQALTIDSQLTKNMQSVGNNTFMAKEADDGLFVMARKYAGEPGIGSVDDKWVLFKTDKPGMFVPTADLWAKVQIQAGKWNPTASLADDGGDVYNMLKGYFHQMPLRNYQALAQSPGGVAGVINKLLPQGVRDAADNEAIQRLGEVLKETLAPRIHQFKKNWRANWIVNGAKTAFDEAETMTQTLLNGKIKLDPGMNLWRAALKDSKTGLDDLVPVRASVEALSEADMAAFHKHIWRPGATIDQLETMVQSGVISPEVREFAKNLDAVDLRMRQNVNKVEGAVGKSPTTWKDGHYGLSRVWEGDTRVPIQNDAGEVFAIASGPNRKAALANAEKIVAENPGSIAGKDFSLSSLDKDTLAAIPEGIRPVVKAASWMLERQDMRGFRWDIKAFTKQEFLEAYEGGLRSRNNYQANLATTDMLQPQLDTLMREDPAAYRQVVARMNDYAGVQSKFSKWQNAAADKVLAPMLGTNSATRIVGMTNTAMFNLQLGALKLAYPVVNALQFVQTTIPEAAFILGKAPPDTLAGKYSFFAAGGTKGPVSGMGVLSPVKLMYTSMKEMGNPTPELKAAFQKAVNDRVIDPRVVEGYVGESAIAVKDYRKAMGSGKDFVEWLRAVSEFMPAQTERMSRTHTFTVGYGVARDFLKNRDGTGLNPEQIYSFARQFTENTMYLYSAADKPRVFTTPAGSAMGLFKNWMFHYMASMGEYASEGFARNNWAPLVWQTTGTAVLGGLSATPLMWAAEGASKMLTNKTAMEVAYDQFGAGGDAVMLGLPAAVTGISLYSQVNSIASNPTRDAATLFSVATWDRAKYLGKAVGAAMDNWQATGQHPADAQGVRELLMRAFAPTTVYRLMQAANDGEIRSLGTGYPIVRDIPAHHRILYGLGFNPTELDRGQAVSNALWESQAKHKAQVNKLGTAWAEAQMGGDSRAMAVILRQGMVWGLDVSSVIKSGMTIVGNTQKTAVERKIRPGDIGKYSAILNAGKGE